MGTHEGVHRYTIGQRKGLGVALGSPAFVVGIDAQRGAVRLGKADDLLHTGARLRDARFFADVALPLRANVQVRYRHGGVTATLEREGGDVRVTFDEPVRAVAKGQVAVAYAGDRVLGGGTIEQVVGAGA